MLTRSRGSFEEVLEGSDAKVPKRLREQLPELLWLYFMGIVLFWVYDPTPGVAATASFSSKSLANFRESPPQSTYT